MKNLPYLLSLHTIRGLGPVRLSRLIKAFLDPKLIWNASLSELVDLIPVEIAKNFIQTRKLIDPEKYFQDLQKLNIKTKTIFDKDYPKLLRFIASPPLILYFSGTLTSEDDYAIAIVGSRKASPYGKKVTETFTHSLSRAKLTIISGLAEGIDTTAHRSALATGGRTIAILAGGISKIFPEENSELAKEIIQNGAIISQYPPSYPYLAPNFPARNRIIAGLTLATLVTEASLQSGSLITAREALDQGKDVYAIPGPIDAPSYLGTAKLIKNGAYLVTSPDDILDAFNINQPTPHLLPLSALEKQILQQIKTSAKSTSEISLLLKVSTKEITETLLKLQIHGFIKVLANSTFLAN